MTSPPPASFMILSFQNCLSKGACGDNGPCEYKPIGMANSPRTCDYIDFDNQVKIQINEVCSNSTYVGSFTYCNNLLKDSYPIASSCFYPPTVTTLVSFTIVESLYRELQYFIQAPSSGRLRKNLNIWKI